MEDVGAAQERWEKSAVERTPIIDAFAAWQSAPARADIDGDCDVDVDDLLLLLAAWGPCAGCPADLDGDGVVSVTDLLQLLARLMK